MEHFLTKSASQTLRAERQKADDGEWSFGRALEKLGGGLPCAHLRCISQTGETSRSFISSGTSFARREPLSKKSVTSSIGAPLAFGRSRRSLLALAGADEFREESRWAPVSFRTGHRPSSAAHLDGRSLSSFPSSASIARSTSGKQRRDCSDAVCKLRLRVVTASCRFWKST